MLLRPGPGEKEAECEERWAFYCQVADVTVCEMEFNQ